MENVKCLICCSENSNTFITLQDRLKTTLDYFTIVRCKCGFHYLNPRPCFKEIYPYYNNTDYEPHSKNYSLLRLMFAISRKYTFKMKKDTILKYVEKGSNLLDYGSGDGLFSEYMKHHGFITSNHDPITKNGIEPPINIKYDIITFWHSLEHIHDIDNVMEYITSYLCLGGYIFVAVPNINAPEKCFFKTNWSPYDIPRHLYHFDKDSLVKYFNKYSLELVYESSIFLDMIYNIILSCKQSGFIYYYKLLYIIPYMCIKYLFLSADKKSTLFYVFKLKK